MKIYPPVFSILVLISASQITLEGDHHKFFAPEICDNQIDDDGDGLIDCLDGDCTYSANCENARELPYPSANLESIPAGSLLIPMDHQHQNIGSVFNMKSYGLVVHILYDFIPVKWIIRSGKQKSRNSGTVHDTNDDIDVSALVSEIAPIPSAIQTLEDFRAGLFVIPPSYATQALSVINSYNTTHTGSEVRIYELLDTTVMDVRYTLTNRPKIAVLNDGGNNGIHQNIYLEAGLVENVHFFLQDELGNDILVTNLDFKDCYTVLSEPHTAQGDVLDSQVDNLRNYLESGGNFLAQCHAVQAYETETPPIESYTGEFLTTLGVEVTNQASTPFYYPNSDLPFNQFTGDLDPTGGSGQDWLPSPDPLGNGTPSELQNNAHPSVINNDDGDGIQEFRAWSGKLNPNMVGSNIFYLGGHDYGTSTTDLAIINGNRMLLNAALVPATRDFTCEPLPEFCFAIAENDNGVLYSWDTTGAFSQIGTLNAQAVESMSFNYNGSSLMAMDTGTIGIVDTLTGAFTPCQPLSQANGAVGIMTIDDVDGLTMDKVTGYLIGIESRGSEDVMLMIDPQSCDIVFDYFGPGIDYLEITGASDAIDDIAVNPINGQIYAISSGGSGNVDTLITIDRATGATTRIVILDECDFEGLTFNNQGRLFGSTGTSACNFDNAIQEINLSTGQTTHLVTLPTSDVEALACYNYIPEICGSGRDEDDDGLVDCADPDCACESCGDILMDGFVFIDNNSDTIYNAGDDPEPGIQVFLYQDLNRDSLLGTSDLLVDSAITAIDGSYSFVQPFYAMNRDTLQVIQSSDDATDGNNNNAKLNIGNDWVGVRFNSVTLPPGATLDCAYLQFYAAGDKDKQPSGTRIFVHDVPNSTTFINPTPDVSTRLRSTSFVDWTMNAWVKNDLYQTEDVSVVIDEYIQTFGPLNGNPLTFILEPTGTEVREAYSFDEDPALAPSLILTYTDALNGQSYIMVVDNQTIPYNATFTTDNIERSFFQASGQTDADNNFGLFLNEDCINGLDDDRDGLIDCNDPDCGMLTIQNISVGPCIDQPLMDIAEMQVTLSWAEIVADTFEVSVYGKTEYLYPTVSNSSDSVIFTIPADGAVNDTIIASWRNVTYCQDTSFYTAPVACNSDTISCAILYLCGDNKAIDADAFDHGLIAYLDAVNGSSPLSAALTKPDGSGLGLYDPDNPASVVSIDFSTIDIIIFSASTIGRVAPELIDTVKDMSLSILNMNAALLAPFGMSSTPGEIIYNQDFVYSDNTTTVEVYNFNTLNPVNDPAIIHGDYIAGATPYTWATLGSQTLDQDGILFSYNAGVPLPGISNNHGIRVHLGYHVDGVYHTNENNSIPSPQEAWLQPARHLTILGKDYLDTAIKLADVCSTFCPTATMNPHILYFGNK